MNYIPDFEAVKELFAGGGIVLSREQYEGLDRYAELLVDWNQKMNLTAITDPEGIAMKHFFDSVYPFWAFEAARLPEGARLIDVGTGAGFPSCPLKIFRPDLELTLLDSLNKRVRFLGELSEELGLGAECIHGRAEELNRKEGFRGQFDAATARAVANLEKLCGWCLPFVKKGGVFVALKGSGGREELAAAEREIKKRGGEVILCEDYALPNGDGRCVIVIKKK
ncbi:MAG: 16S rRNA (guanine(527)-N(7))-methyltransferase RsmG [Ruminococcus sp.]|nr:16S rRNA (guanine(527)-N(7))-methyltransferase RsmG [Ruminococcus sp.]